MVGLDVKEDWAEADAGVLDPEPAVDAALGICDVEAAEEAVAARLELCVRVTVVEAAVL